MIELLAQHAPNDEIKEMLKDNVNIENNAEPKISVIPSQPNRLPSFSDIETPKTIPPQNDNQYDFNHAEMPGLEGKLKEKQNIIQKLNEVNEKLRERLNEYQNEIDEHKAVEIRLND